MRKVVLYQFPVQEAIQLLRDRHGLSEDVWMAHTEFINHQEYIVFSSSESVLDESIT